MSFSSTICERLYLSYTKLRAGLSLRSSRFGPLSLAVIISGFRGITRLGVFLFLTSSEGWHMELKVSEWGMCGTDIRNQGN